MISRLIEVLYAQFAIHSVQEKYPFNIWTDDHVKQCLSWQKSSICFKTLIEDGPHLLEIGLHKSNIDYSEFDTVIYCPLLFNSNSFQISTHIESLNFAVKSANMIEYRYKRDNDIPCIYLNFFEDSSQYFDIFKCDGNFFTGEITNKASSAV